MSFHLCFSYYEQSSAIFQTFMFVVFFFSVNYLFLSIPIYYWLCSSLFLLGDLYILGISTISNVSRKRFSNYHLCFYLFAMRKFLYSFFFKAIFFSFASGCLVIVRNFLNTQNRQEFNHDLPSNCIVSE